MILFLIPVFWIRNCGDFKYNAYMCKQKNIWVLKMNGILQGTKNNLTLKKKTNAERLEKDK